MAAGEFKVHVFRNDRGLIALTGDAEGTSLPRVDGPWHFVRTVSLSGNTGDERHALDLIGLYGFCCLDEHPEGAEDL